MGFVMLIVGLLMIITGARGTYAQFGTQFASEFQSTGTFGQPGYHPGFQIWLLAIGIVGAIGYVKELQLISRAFMTLIIISIFLSQKGFFAQFQAALSSGPKQPNAIPSQSNTASPTNPSGGPTINLGPLGSINENPIVPGGLTDRFLGLFGAGSTSQ